LGNAINVGKKKMKRNLTMILFAMIFLFNEIQAKSFKSFPVEMGNDTDIVVHGKEGLMQISDPNFPLVQLPADFQSNRTTKRFNPSKGEEVEILNARGPGCVRHFWITTTAIPTGRTSNIRIKIYCDDNETPLVDMKMNQFFGVLLKDEPYRIESAPIKILPKSGFNSYFPIPFQKSCRMILCNTDDTKPGIWSMVNWHSYDKGVEITPYRFHASYRVESPAEEMGTYLVGDIPGRGFVAGLLTGIRRTDFKDIIYHTGGDTWLLDGEINPHVLRGIGVEDVFGQSFGFNLDNSQWSGCPFVDVNGGDCSEGVAYRFFGPDCVYFKSSMVLRMGSRANHTESVIYYYLDESRHDIPKVKTPEKWLLSGPFECKTKKDFDKVEFPEKPVSQWPDSWQWGNRTLKPVELASERTWLDFTRCFRRNKNGNTGTQPVDAAAYAQTSIDMDAQRQCFLHLGFDDWIKIWVNGVAISSIQHNNGFAVERIPVNLKKGENAILVKISNQDNIEWRCWAFSCRIESTRFTEK
jgi:hypothetical protein